MANQEGYLLGPEGQTSHHPIELIDNGNGKFSLMVGGIIVATISGVVDTELPAAALLADAMTNPTTPTVGAAIKAYNGVTWDRLRIPTIFKSLQAVAIGAIATVWTPAGGKKFRLMGGSVSISAAASVLLEDNAGGTTIIQLPALLANVPYQFDLANGILSGAANRVLKATASVTPCTITGFLYGAEE
jgi:hypothetical protein